MPDWIDVSVELRHASWHVDEVFDLLAWHRAAYVVMSGAHLPCVLRATAPLVYVRLHGPDHGHLYAGSYSHNNLRWWADRMREWQGHGKDVYAYFDNDGVATPFATPGNSAQTYETELWDQDSIERQQVRLCKSPNAYPEDARKTSVAAKSLPVNSNGSFRSTASA